MHKLITLSDAQYENAVDVMKTTRIESFSEFFRFLVLFYEQNQKRPAGRPRASDAPASDATTEDDIEMYKVPDKFTTSPYSYNDLVAWYDTHPEEGTIPDRDNLIIHPSYKGKRAT